MTIYHPNIPQAGDDPSNSQQDLLDNFQKLNSDFSVDHMPFTAGSGTAGWHRLIRFVTTINAPGNTSGSASALYPHVGSNTASTAAQVWFKNNADRVQLTNIKVVNPGAGSSGDYGFKTPWGVTFNFGEALFDESDITFSVPFQDTPYFILATPHGSTGKSVAVRNVTSTEFRGVSIGSSATCYYFAIGPSTVTT